MSYDDPAALRDFAHDFDIDFPLLSDPNSEVIERFGILNTLVDPDDDTYYGIPYPGAYVVDASGTITAKFFESHIALRANPDQLLRSALGDEITLEPVEPPNEVTAEVTFDGDMLRSSIVRDLLAVFRVPAGQHLYGEPVPQGMVATSIELDELPGLIVGEPVLPPTVEHVLAGTGDRLKIFEGDVLIRLPIMYGGGVSIVDNAPADSATLTGTLRWQACDNDACRLPAKQRFEITLPLALNLPELGIDQTTRRMDARAHKIQMKTRGAKGSRPTALPE